MRFLQQASFGATQADIDRVRALGYNGWLDEQLAMPVQYSHLNYVNRVTAAYNPSDQWYKRPGVWNVNDSMWLGMVPSADQLRQRVMFALSQIFVVSIADGSVYYQGTGLAAYVDMLYAKGFGNFRDLLEGVTLSSAMGNYLSSMYNRKEDPLTGSNPDQNFAREVMQLFTIGLYELNNDGTRKLVNGQPIQTYDTPDVIGVSRVMTGWGYNGATTVNWFQYYDFNTANDMPRQALPMSANNSYHSTSEKKFLGVTIPAGSANAAADLKILLDRLFNHANVGPFIGKQLIQRLVTSNPSPAYVNRVANAFNNNGAGVRGDMKAVIKAILLDTEARSAGYITGPTFGRIREPIHRLAQLMRVFKATRPTDPDSYNISTWEYDKSKGLWQTPLRAKSVFNFYTPDYQPPGSALKAQGLVAPEMQITTASSVADMADLFDTALQVGGWTDCCSDVQRNTFYTKFDYSEYLPLVTNPNALFDKLNLFFMAGQMPQSLRTQMLNAMNNRTYNRARDGIVRDLNQLKLAAAIYTMMFSPEYVVQK